MLLLLPGLLASMFSNHPEPYSSILAFLKKLEVYPQYLGGFVFGSVARNEETENSDIDAIMITESDCENISHPTLYGKKLDISFYSPTRITKMTRKQIKEARRIPMLSESLVLFDKTGLLNKLEKKAKATKPKAPNQNGINTIKFMLYHATDKAKRNLSKDPDSANLAMNININDILKYHYELNQRWWVSNKRLLSDLSSWDFNLSKLLTRFLNTHEVNKKFILWESIVDYVALPVGDWRHLEEANCQCPNCKAHLSLFTNE